MIEVNLFFNYITSLLTKKPLEFDRQNYVYVNMLNCLKSVEYYHKLILNIQKRTLGTDDVKKYSRTYGNKSDNILIYCNETLKMRHGVTSSLNFHKKSVIIESKKNVLNILKETDLNKKLLLRKIKREIEQAQLKLNELHNIFDLSLNVHTQLLSQNTENNTKVNEMFALMNSMECQLKTGIVYFKSNINELKKNITEIFKDIILDFEITNMIHKPCKCLNDFDLGLLKSYNELKKNIDSIDEMNVLKSLKIVLENENLYDIDWNDFLKTYNYTKEKHFFVLHQNFNIVTIINTLMNNLNHAEQTFNDDLRNMVRHINNVHYEQTISNEIMDKLNKELEELKKNNSILKMFNLKSDNLNLHCIEIINNLEKEIHVSDDQLTIAIKNNEKLNYNLEHSDSLFNITFQNYINQLDIEYKLIFLRENKVKLLNKDLNITIDKYNVLLTQQKIIMMDQFNRKKLIMEAIINKKKQHIVDTCDVINSYKNKINIYKEYIEQLKDINKSKTNANNDLLLIYQDLIFQNHGKDLEQLKDEGIELTNYINLYNKELDELNKEDRRIDDYSKLMLLNMNNEIKNLDEKLQQVANANESLKIKKCYKN